MTFDVRLAGMWERLRQVGAAGDRVQGTRHYGAGNRAAATRLVGRQLAVNGDYGPIPNWFRWTTDLSQTASKCSRRLPHGTPEKTVKLGERLKSHAIGNYAYALVRVRQ